MEPSLLRWMWWWSGAGEGPTHTRLNHDCDWSHWTDRNVGLVGAVTRGELKNGSRLEKLAEDNPLFAAAGQVVVHDPSRYVDTADAEGTGLVDGNP